MSDFKLDTSHLKKLLESVEALSAKVSALSSMNRDMRMWADSSEILPEVYDEFAALLNDGQPYDHRLEGFPRTSNTCIHLRLSSSAVEDLFEIGIEAIEDIEAYGPKAPLPEFDEHSLHKAAATLIMAGWKDLMGSTVEKGRDDPRLIHRDGGVVIDSIFYRFQGKAETIDKLSAFFLEMIKTKDRVSMTGFGLRTRNIDRQPKQVQDLLDLVPASGTKIIPEWHN